MKTRVLACVLSLPVLGIAILGAANEENWPGFRGHNGAGTADFKVPAKWTDDTLKWEIKLPGSGHGSPVVWGDKVFLNTAREKGAERLVLCIDAPSGKILWTKVFASETHKTNKRNAPETRRHH